MTQLRKSMVAQQIKLIFPHVADSVKDIVSYLGLA